MLKVSDSESLLLYVCTFFFLFSFALQTPDGE